MVRTNFNAQCSHSCVGVFQGLEFIADNKEEQSRTLLANVAAVNDELQGIVSSLHTGNIVRLMSQSLSMNLQIHAPHWYTVQPCLRIWSSGLLTGPACWPACRDAFSNGSQPTVV